MIRAEHFRVGERPQASSYLHRQLLRALHRDDEMAGVLQLLDLLREVVEEHPWIGHAALSSGIAESLLQQRAVHNELSAVLPQVHATVPFVKLEFTMKPTQPYTPVRPLRKTCSSQRAFWEAPQALCADSPPHTQNVSRTETFAQLSCHCTNTRPAQLLYVESCFASLLITNGPSRLLRYIR